MAEKHKPLPLRALLPSLLALIAVGSLVSLILFYMFLVSTDNDLQFMNIAGRQRMLSVKMRELARRAAASGSEADKQGLRQAIGEFEGSQNALEAGGLIGGMGLPPSPTSVLNEVRAASDIWAEVREDLEAVAKGSGDRSPSDAVRTRIDEGTQALLDASQRILDSYSSRSRILRTRMLITLLVVAIANAVLFAVGIAMMRRRLFKPLRLLRATSDRVADGEIPDTVWAAGVLEFEGVAEGLVELARRTQTSQQALSDSEERQRLLVDLAPETVAIHSDGAVVFVNKAGIEMLGAHSAEQVLGKPVIEFVHPDYRPAVLDRIRSMMQTGMPAPMLDEKLLRLDGTAIDVELVARPFTHNGKPAVLVVARDITLRKSLYELLKRSEEIHRLVLDNVNEIVYLVEFPSGDPMRGEVVFVSGKVREILGCDPRAFTEDPALWSSIIHPDDVQSIEGVTRRMFERKQEVVREYRMRHLRTGEEIWVEDRVTPRLDPRGNVVGIFGVARDMTERRRAEVALRESEERYRELFENANDIVYSHDMSGRFISVNRAGELISGYSRQEVATMNITSIVAPEYHQKIKQLVTAGTDNGLPPSYEIEIVRKDGRRVPLEISARFAYRNGKAVGVHGIARDITERKQSAEALKGAEEQLRQSQKMDAVGRLAGGIAHDFNNLLTAIDGYADMLLSRIGTESPHRRHVEEIRKAADRAAMLTRKLLAFSRRRPVQPVVLDLNTVVADMDAMLRRLIGEDIQLTTSLAPDTWSIKAEAGQIEQVILNLALNARDAMPTGGTLRIGTRNVEIASEDGERRTDGRSGPFVLLSVSDTGTGIDEATRSHLFEPFFTTKAVGKGTGLGLSVVYGIVTQSGGWVEVVSEVARGTELKIYMPRADAPKSTAGDAGRPADAPTGSETILLVEDEELVRSMAAEVLRLRGYTVVEAASAEQALTLARQWTGRLDLVLTDVVMPGMSGPDMAAVLVEERPGLRFVFISGYVPSVSARPTKQLGESAFVPKPFTPDGLARKVREVLDRPVVQPLQRF